MNHGHHVVGHANSINTLDDVMLKDTEGNMATQNTLLQKLLRKANVNGHKKFAMCFLYNL